MCIFVFSEFVLVCEKTSVSKLNENNGRRTPSELPICRESDLIMDQLVELTSKGICLGSYQDRGKKLGLWPRVITEAKRCTFWPRPNMPRFQIRGKMSKITGAESPFCTGEYWTCVIYIYRCDFLLWHNVLLIFNIIKKSKLSIDNFHI